MSNAIPSTRAIFHDARYRTVEMEGEVLRDFTILRLLFINKTIMGIMSPAEVDSFIQDLNLPDFKALDQVC